MLKLGATIFWGRLIFEDLRYLLHIPCFEKKNFFNLPLQCELLYEPPRKLLCICISFLAQPYLVFRNFLGFWTHEAKVVSERVGDQCIKKSLTSKKLCFTKKVRSGFFLGNKTKVWLFEACWFYSSTWSAIIDICFVPSIYLYKNQILPIEPALPLV